MSDSFVPISFDINYLTYNSSPIDGGESLLAENILTTCIKNKQNEHSKKLIIT